jgi:hypothetical protein
MGYNLTPLSIKVIPWITLMERGVRLLPMWLIRDTFNGERCQVITQVADRG